MSKEWEKCVLSKRYTSKYHFGLIFLRNARIITLSRKGDTTFVPLESTYRCMSFKDNDIDNSTSLRISSPFFIHFWNGVHFSWF